MMLNKLGTQPPILAQAVTSLGLTFGAIHAAQLIHVLAQGSGALLRCYLRNAQQIWYPDPSLGGITGYIGRNGISSQKKEGDGRTPSGLFRLGYAFGSNEKPETKMAFRKTTTGSVWVDDPNSCYYNTWAEPSSDCDWVSAEHLCDYSDSYAYAVIIEYNTAPVSRAKGSAIFLHCGNRPTSGCVAVPEHDLLKILKWLDPDKAPAILISAG
jgi:L,D-peptidoglycan transpeptidase YkuD (ErfK/YbiS/YcfS/YnhG family)